MYKAKEKEHFQNIKGHKDDNINKDINDKKYESNNNNEENKIEEKKKSKMTISPKLFIKKIII